MSIKPIQYSYGSIAISTKKGDSWSELSLKFEVSEMLLKKENKQTTELKENQLVIIPQTNSHIHIVAPTETVESICEKYKVSKQGLQALNGQLFLYVGKKLFLPKE